MLTPCPLKKIGISHMIEVRIKIKDKGRKIRIGLNKTTMFIISIRVSRAVRMPMVLFPALRWFIFTGISKTRFRWYTNVRAMTSLKAIESGQI